MNVIIDDRVSMAFCGVLSKVSLGSGTLFSAIDPTRPTRARRRITGINLGAKKTRRGKPCGFVVMT